MSFSVGIIGLPNVGKSTLFKALTKKSVDIASYPFTTINPNVGIVAVPDKRLEKIAGIIKPKKVTLTIIEFFDIAGLVRGAHKGEGLGNQFLAQVRNCDAILEIVRVFKADQVEHVEGNINPQRDIETIKLELLMKDLKTLENLLPELEKNAKTGDKKALKKLDFFKKIKDSVSQGATIFEINLTAEEREGLKDFQLLTAKPIIYVLNVDNEPKEAKNASGIFLNLKIEEEISELSEAEFQGMGIKSQLDRLILACYNILELITFYTIAGGEEARAWTLKNGQKILRAAGSVHSDFEERFIKAEIISWQALISAGSWGKTREKGQIKAVGREYVVQDGDIVEFKI